MRVSVCLNYGQIISNLEGPCYRDYGLSVEREACQQGDHAPVRGRAGWVKVGLLAAVVPTSTFGSISKVESLKASQVGPSMDVVERIRPTVNLETHALPTGGLLMGLPGAATALAIGDMTRAIALTTSFDETEPPTENPADWYLGGALRGRAMRLAGELASANEVLLRRWDERNLERYFPRDVLGVELATTKLAWSRELPPEQADAELREAIAILDKTRRLDDIRNLAAMRVLQVEAMLARPGTSARSTRSVARRAAKAVQRVLKDYPLHPRAGELWLEEARALVRADQVVEAAEVYRDIHIHRAGEPESELAWQELQALAGRERRVRAPELSTSEKVTRAAAARSLRWVELSRSILDTVVEDPQTPSYLRDDARSHRAWTAYKQRDYAQCVADLQVLYEASPNYELRDRLLACLERGEMYDDALSIWSAYAQSKKKHIRLQARWSACQLALRAGRYADAERWLKAYETSSRGHASTRAWLHAWLPMQQGRTDEAIAGFERSERYASDRTRARYFRGKLLLTRDNEDERQQGVGLLTGLIHADPYGYYGLQARQRLLDHDIKPPEIVKLEAVADESYYPTRRVLQALFDELDAEFGSRWPSVRRAKQLFAAGYIEAARREVRIAIELWSSGGGKTSGVRSEAYYVGIGWKSSWSHPRLSLSKKARADRRDADTRERLRIGLRMLAKGLNEPYGVGRLSTPEDGAWKARWQPRAFRFAVEREARLYGVDPIHMWSLMYTESRFRRFVVSHVGARGALQIMPWTARQLAVRMGELEPRQPFDNDTLFDIDVNAHLAGKYVDELLSKFHGQGPMAYASYNGGPSNVARWLAAKADGPTPLEMDEFIEEMVFLQSYRYTKRVMEVGAMYALLYHGELPRFANTVDARFEDNIDF